jgi:erythromycin esterase
MGTRLSAEFEGKILFLSSVFVLLTSVVTLQSDYRVGWLKEHVYKISTVEPYTNDFSDLQFLKGILDRTSIVILGERFHTDGTTKLAKSRVVRFLHEQMGFNVLVYEGDIYSYRKVNQLLKPGMNDKEILQLIDDANTNDPLYNYIDSSTCYLDLYLGHSITTSHPLKLAGIDIFNSNPRIKYMKDEFKSFISGIDSSVERKKQVEEYLNGTEKMDDFYYYHDTIKFKRFLLLTNILIDLIQNKKIENKEDFFWIQILRTNIVNAEVFGGMKERCKKEKGFIHFAPRDKVMAENVQWILDHEYKGEKIIIWTANYHATRNISTIKGLKGHPSDSTTMGNYLYKKYGDKVYSMVFVPYSGHTGNRGYFKSNSFMAIPKHNGQSMESLLHKTGYAYGFLNLRDIPLGGEWLREENRMYPSFWNETRAKWPEIYDGIFYIDVMKPDYIIYIYKKGGYVPVSPSMIKRKN